MNLSEAEKLQPPHNISAEKSVLSAMMLKGEAIEKASAILVARDFYRETHKVLYSSLLSLHYRGEPATLVNVTEELKKEGYLERVGGVGFITAILNTEPTAANVESHAQVVKSYARKRRLMEAGLRLALCAQGDEADEEAAVKEAVLGVVEAETGGSVAGAKKASDSLIYLMGSIDEPRVRLSTGFKNLDSLLSGGLMPGLYVLGAISSLGKTTFAQQIADHIAESYDVLFICLEMSRNEMLARSLSRLMARMDQTPNCRNARSDTEILYDYHAMTKEQQNLLNDACEIYSKLGEKIFIKEGLANITAADVRGAVQYHKLKYGHAPLVIVDYLQILAPADPRATDKQNVDRAVVELKQISRDFNTPVLAISSFNRDNYKGEVNLAAFKESGSVEYSADVVLGLQLAGTGEGDFDFKKAMRGETSPLGSYRQIEAVILKNRHGRANEKINFKYYPRFNTFIEQSDRSITRGGDSPRRPRVTVL